jgi:hypothetical protein
MMNKTNYPDNPTEEQCKVIENILELQKLKRTHLFTAIYLAFIF